MTTLHVTVADGVAETIRQRAAARGKTVEEFLAEEYPPAKSSANPPYRQKSWEEIERIMAEVFAKTKTKLPATDCTYSREDIYFDHD